MTPVAGRPATKADAASSPGWRLPTARRVRAIRDRLRLVYGRPLAQPHGHPIAELILTVLSQSTNDRNRDIAYLALRERFPTWEEVRDAPIDELEETIRPGGISKIKSVRIKSILQAITDTAPAVPVSRESAGHDADSSPESSSRVAGSSPESPGRVAGSSRSRLVVSPARLPSRLVVSPARLPSRLVVSPARTGSRLVVSPARTGSRLVVSPARTGSRLVVSPARPPSRPAAGLSRSTGWLASRCRRRSAT